MRKRGSKLLIYNTAIFEIILLISLSFAISIILSDNYVGAIPVTEQGPPAGKYYEDITGRGLSRNLEGATDDVAESGAKGGGTFLGKLFGGKIFGTTTKTGFVGGALVSGLLWAGVAAVAVQMIGGLLGLDKGVKDALTYGAAAGTFTGAGLYTGLNNAGIGKVFGISSGVFSLGVGAAIGIGVFIATYKKEKKQLVNFECLPFEPPLRGDKCEECNKDPFRPCSEYRCRSLGQACELLNAGTEDEKCAWVNPNDVNSPSIEAWGDALNPEELEYVPDDAIRPPNRGVKIVGTGENGCLKPFTPLEFGIATNEPAQCKIDYIADDFDDLSFYFGGTNYYRYNHTQKMKLPAPDTSEVGEDVPAPELENDGSFSLYARCRDANGNTNEDAFVFNFCVDPSPDTTPPIIEGFSIEDGSPVRFGADSVPIEAYVNEPAECRWSRESKSYEEMENEMECATETFQINSLLSYTCSGNLTGIENKKENDFYFRCKDQPDKPDSERNVMVQSEKLTLRGSQGLNIISVGPNGTIFGSTEIVPVGLTAKTDDGADEGRAICYVSATGETDSYVPMAETNSFEHRQQLDLPSGDYQYFFRCVDAGGNTAEDETSFSVVIDKQPPIVTRAYREEGLKIVTNENAQCVYSLSSCNYEFEEGLPMIYSNPEQRRNHFAEWQTNAVYYIKCGDDFGNVPSPNECNIVVNTIELGE